MSFRFIRRVAVPAALFSLAFAASAQGRTELLVYTALEADQVQAYKAAFDVPGRAPRAHPSRARGPE